MSGVVVPGPEPEWETAAGYQGGKRNPALQESMWEYAGRHFRMVAGLSPSLESLAARLRLRLERGWEDLGWVEVAMFRIGGKEFALSRFEGAPEAPVFVWVGRQEPDAEGALGVLVQAVAKSASKRATRRSRRAPRAFRS